MFTRLLNVKWRSNIVDNAHFSSGLYLRCLRESCFSGDGLSYVHSSVFKMFKAESFPIFMWLPLTEFTNYSETVFSIDNHLVFSYKSSLYHYTK